MSSTRKTLANVNLKLTRSVRVSDADLLNLFLGVHSVPLGPERSTDLVDVCFNVGEMWKGVPYRPLRCDIDPKHPNLDIVCDWRNLPERLGQHIVKTAVADPLFMAHLGKTSKMRGSFGTEHNEFEDDDILPQVESLLDAARKLLHPTEGALILKIGDQVHAGPRQWQPDKVLALAEQTGWLKCDRWINPSQSMPQTRRLNVFHLPSQVWWLVLHTGTECPGPGFVLPGRIRCAYRPCGRVVAVKRERQPGYCRPPRTCRQDAYEERLKKAA